MSFTREQVAQIYVATFNRAPDAAGLDYWVNDSGFTNIEDVASSFFDSTEASLLYASATSSAQKVQVAYQNLFNRSADTAGLNYWVGELDSGNISQSLMLQALINGAQDTVEFGADSTLMANKTAVALSFANKGLDDVTLAASILDNVTENPQSVESVIASFSSSSTSLSNINLALGTLSTSTTTGVKELDADSTWDSSTTVTYSFNSSIPNDYYDYNDYVGTAELTQGWTALNYEQKTTVRTIMQEINKFLGIELQEISSGGDIELNLVDIDDPNTSGFAFNPGTNYEYYGDIFLTTSYNDPSQDYSLQEGGWGYSTIAHELGHALGLKHPFESPNTLPTGEDNLNHTIMSYENVNNYIPILSFTSTGIAIDYRSLNPNFYSIYDIAALQSFYGVNETTNLEDNTYSLYYSDYELITIWDAGGLDTIDLSNETGSSTIDLRSGSLNSADQQTLTQVIATQQSIAAQHNKSQHNDWIADNITDLYTDNDLYTGIDNLGIAVGVIIENVTTGIGNDVITDNEVNNTILTGAGNDSIYLGHGGEDYLDAGAGEDKLYLDISFLDLNISKSSDIYTITTDTFKVNFTNVEQVQLSNGVSYTPEVLIA